MKTTSVLTLFAIFQATSGFSVAPQRSLSSRAIRESRTAFATSTIDTNEASTEESTLSPEESMNLQLKAREMEVSQSVVLTNDYSNFDYAHLYAFTHLYVFTHLLMTSYNTHWTFKDVRMELVQKYVSAGKSHEYAEQEVDKFLSDPERSEQYLDMRRYAEAQQNELMGFESIFVIGGAFFVGLMGNVGMKYLSAYKVSTIVEAALGFE